MKRTTIAVLVVGAIAFSATAAYAAAQPSSQQTPKGWTWTPGKDGKRTERPNDITTNADGSTREVVRNGNCTTIKEKSAAGEYKQSTQCNPR